MRLRRQRHDQLQLVPATRIAVLGGPKAAIEFIWTERSASPSAIGGKALRGRVDGHLCPACDEAVNRAGSFGVAAMGRALAVYLDATGRTDAARSLRELGAGTSWRGSSRTRCAEAVPHGSRGST